MQTSNIPYLISIEQGFNLFRKAIVERDFRQYSIWVNTTDKVFEFILTKAYKNGNKNFESLKEIIYDFLTKYNASDLFTDNKVEKIIDSKLKIFQYADILNSMKYS